MSNVLAEILANKRIEVEQRQAAAPAAALRVAAGFGRPPRDFFGAVAAPCGRRLNVIAEIKRRSPSAGEIVAEFDPANLAARYAAAGAAALSVLTDERYFGGRLADIERAKAACGLPVLRKDFLIDEYQLVESRAAGADAVLLIAEALPAARLVSLLRAARELDLCVLLEVHTAEALRAVMQAWPDSVPGGVLIGINNRDLRTQAIDLATVERIAPRVPGGFPIVAESGIRSRGDADRMHAAGAHALLVGEALLRSRDLAAAVRDLAD